MPTPSVTRVALYTRVSTDMQASKDEGSLDTQEARLRAAVASRAGRSEVVRVFREEGESGKSLDRPELQAMLAGIRAGEFDLLMVTRIDRLSRSLMDFHQVHELMQRQGVQFWSLNESFDTSTAVGPALAVEQGGRLNVSPMICILSPPVPVRPRTGRHGTFWGMKGEMLMNRQAFTGQVARQAFILACTVMSFGIITSCADPILGDNDLFCSVSDQDRCYDAGCTDGDNSESPNASSANCSSECREHYCDGYCDCEIWLWNEECSECM